MVFRDNPKRYNDAGYDLGESFLDAMSPSNIVRRLVLFLIFGVILAMRTLVDNLDNVGRSGGGLFDYVGAIGNAMWEGIFLSLGSLWVVIQNPMGYINSSSWGSILFVIASFIVLIMFFFQPISLFMNIVDGQKGQSTGIPLRMLVTIILIIIMSAIVYYAGLGSNPMVNALPMVNESVNSTINMTLNETVSNGGSIIDLL